MSLVGFTATLTASQSFGAVLADYRFETGPNGGAVASLVDSGPNTLNGTVGARSPGLTYTSNTPANATSNFALDASGDGSWGEVANTPALNPAGSFTVECYARPSATYGGSNSSGDLIVAKKSGEIGNALESYGLAYSNDAHRFYASMDTDPSHNGIAVLSNVVTPGEWHELALVYSSNGANSSLALYVDHVLQNSTTGNFAPNYANFPLLIGAGNYLGDPSGPFRRNFDGLIDEVRISDQALTPAQLLPAVPEPASIGAFAIGAAGFLLGRRRRD